jgi:hypothetical protein
MPPTEQQSEHFMGGAAPGNRINEAALRSEIAFWQEMIGARGDALPVEAVERMHHALALAEKRLMELYTQHAANGPARVFHLSDARRNAS